MITAMLIGFAAVVIGFMIRVVDLLLDRVWGKVPKAKKKPQKSDFWDDFWNMP